MIPVEQVKRHQDQRKEMAQSQVDYLDTLTATKTQKSLKISTESSKRRPDSLVSNSTENIPEMVYLYEASYSETTLLVWQQERPVGSTSGRTKILRTCQIWTLFITA